MDDIPARFDFDNAEPRGFVVEEADAGARLDVFLSRRLDEFSRAGVQRLIQRGVVQVNGTVGRAAARLRAGDRIEVAVPPVLPPHAEPEDLPLRVLLEDEAFVVIDKQPGMAVHPGRGRPSGTIANAVAFRYRGAMGGEPYRPGIVHRLDLETSGAMVIAKTEAAHAALADSFRQRTVKKEYRALVHGAPAHDEECVDLPLGRDVHKPARMAVRFDKGREAQTDVVVLERWEHAAYVLCRPHTGRTHQIRVHMLTLGHPLLGDRMYAGGLKPSVDVPRLMLHAHKLAFPHPETGVEVAVEAPLPSDFEDVLLALRL